MSKFRVYWRYGGNLLLFDCLADAYDYFCNVLDVTDNEDTAVSSFVYEIVHLKDIA